MAPTPRPGVLDIEPYVGGESQLPGVARVARLASNENPLGPSPDAARAYVELADALHRYPDGGSRALRSRHGFLMYPIAATTAGATAVAAPETDLTADVDALLARVSERTKLVFLANPNNPTGTYLSAESLARLHAGLPGEVLMVIDAAYAEYVTDAPDYAEGAALVEAADNVVMTRTFSKIHGLASLRLGWAYGPVGVVDVLNRVRGPFNVSAAAQAAGVAAIRDRDHVLRSAEHNRVWRDWFRQQAARAGIEALPSAGNFVLLRLESPEHAEAAVAHFKRHGVLVRRMGAYGLAACLRVSIGTEDDMRQAAEALIDLGERTA